ncbi:hypothetical protein M0R45_015902 [Rubus argutus]|uniref:Uncharacterized protein n=1 Tax=Rubus argutus TaxID=59490 RepID=A0AAW1XQJ4_RUBAR
MRQKISTIKDAKRASHLPEIITNIEINEVYASVLGKEKHGAIRGFGIGVRLDDVPDVLVEKRVAQLEVQALREEHEAELDHIRKESQEREAKLRDEMNKQEMATTDRMKRLEMQLLNQQAMFERFFGAGLLPNIVLISQNGAANLNFPTGMGTHNNSLQTSSVDAFETPHHVPISPSTLQKNTPHFNEVYKPQPPTPPPRHQDSLCSKFSTLG